MKHYDLVVIGSGPAGEKGAAQAAYFGKSVALVESRAEPGGVCVHTGTVPSKTLRETSLYLSGVKSRGLYGVNTFVKKDVSAGDFMFRRHHVVDLEVERIRRNFDRHRIDVVPGRGHFSDSNTVEVSRRDGTKQSLSADRFLISTGSTPFHPSTLPFDDPFVFDSDTMLDMEKLPRSLCIIGAGVIGCEYATIFAALGLRVILLDARDQLLPFLDREIAETLRQQMLSLGVQFVNNARVEKVVRTGEQALTLSLETGEGSDDEFEVEAVLFAAGRQGNTANLGLEALGIEVSKRGHIAVNEHFQSSLEHIYAAGDVVGFPALASTSMEQGRVAMCHAFDIAYKDEVSSTLPFGIYTIPEVSAVGLSEEDCEREGIPYQVGRSKLAGNTRGLIMGEQGGLVKLVFCPNTLRILGVHIVAERASELVHIGQAVMQLNGTLDYFIQTVFNYPTLSEAYKYAAYDGLGRLSREVQERGVQALKA